MDHYEFDVLENGKDHFQRPQKKKKKKGERWTVGHVEMVKPIMGRPFQKL